MLQFLQDGWFWLVIIAIAVGLLATVLYFPQVKQSNEVLQAYEQASDRIVVFVKAPTYEQAIKELEKSYLQQGWYISAFDYDKNRKMFIFVLRKEG